MYPSSRERGFSQPQYSFFYTDFRRVCEVSVRSSDLQRDAAEGGGALMRGPPTASRSQSSCSFQTTTTQRRHQQNKTSDCCTCQTGLWKTKGWAPPLINTTRHSKPLGSLSSWNNLQVTPKKCVCGLEAQDSFSYHEGPCLHSWLFFS